MEEKEKKNRATKKKKKENLEEQQELQENLEKIKEEEKEEEKEIVVEKPSGFNILEVVIIMFITLCFGGLLGSALTYAVENKEEVITSVPSELKEFISTYENIKEEYYEQIDEEDLLDAGIEGMVEYLGDKYSIYMDREETEEFNEQVEGEYVGIGSEIQRLENGDTIISNPFENGPAVKAGLKVGDIILKVDGEDVTTWDLDDISKKVKGKAGSKVVLTIRRGEEEMDVEVTREKVEISSVTSQIYEENNKKIGYIKLDIFAANTTAQFEKALLQLESQGIEALAIDVRDNSGGYLSTVKEIASLFLKKGKNIYQLDTKGIVEVVKDSTNASREYPVAVIINRASASASEILAASIKESYDNGLIVGTPSYGKGTVQKAYQLDSGATIKYTIQKWLTPNGNWINEKGVEPTNKVELADSYYENPIEENDNQLKETLRLLAETN